MSKGSWLRRATCDLCTSLRFRPVASKTQSLQSVRRYLQTTTLEHHANTAPTAASPSTVTSSSLPASAPIVSSLERQITTAEAALQSALSTHPQPQRYTLHCIQQLITLYKANNQHIKALHYVNQLWKQYTAAKAVTTSTEPTAPTAKTLGIRFNAAVLPYNEQPTNLPLAFNRRYHNYNNLVRCRLD